MFSSSPRSSTPGVTDGSPMAPSRIASCSWIAARSASGSSSPVALYRRAPRSYSVVSRSGTSLRSTFSASAVTSTPMPSPGMTASFMNASLHIELCACHDDGVGARAQWGLGQVDELDLGGADGGGDRLAHLARHLAVDAEEDGSTLALGVLAEL